MPVVRFENNLLWLDVYIQPKASRDQIQGWHGEELKIAITAPPVDGQANAHLTKFLSKQFKVTKSHIRIVKGELGRHKTVIIESPEIFPSLIAEALA